MSGPLTEEFIANLANVKKDLRKLEDNLDNRITEIWTLIYEGFGKVKPTQQSWWWDTDDIPEISFDDELTFSISYGYKSLKTDEFDYTYGFPARFLTTPNDEIVQTIKDQYVKTLERRSIEQSGDLAKKANKKLLIQQALQKLTPEEIAALNLRK